MINHTQKRIVFLHLVNQESPYIDVLVKGALETWRKNPPHGTRIVSMFGCMPNFSQKMRGKLQGRLRYSFLKNLQLFFDRTFVSLFNPLPSQYADGLITSDIPELHSTIGSRTLSAFEVLLKDPHWEYLWRANLSNYPNLKKIESLKWNFAKRNFVGAEINQISGIQFPSGAAYCLSRDVVEKIVQAADTWQHEYLDDVALGLLLRELCIPLTSIERISFRSPDDVMKMPLKELLDCPSFRCNTGGDRTGDIEIMRAIHQRLTEDRVCEDLN
jgi:hypothetical protein